MEFLNLALVLIILGIIGWLVNDRYSATGSIKTIVNVSLALIVVGMLLWLINTYVPMAGSIKAILNIVVIGAVCVRVLQELGLWGDVVRMWSNLRSHRVPAEDSGQK